MGGSKWDRAPLPFADPGSGKVIEAGPTIPVNYTGALLHEVLPRDTSLLSPQGPMTGFDPPATGWTQNELVTSMKKVRPGWL